MMVKLAIHWHCRATDSASARMRLLNISRAGLTTGPLRHAEEDDVEVRGDEDNGPAHR